MTNWYIKPGGAGSKDGTSGNDWERFEQARNYLSAGDTLYLADGDYEYNTTGLPEFLSSAGWDTGTEASPIIVRATNERAARVLSDGLYRCMRTDGLSYWQFHGIFFQSATNTGQTLALNNVNCDHGGNLRFERCLWRYNNTAGNNHLLGIYRCPGSLIYQCEFLDFEGHGIDCGDTVTIRQSYFNDRDRAVGIYGGKVHADSITMYPAKDVIVENCVFEGVIASCAMVGYWSTINCKVLGCIFISGGDHASFVEDARGDEVAGQVQDSWWENCVSITPNFKGAGSRSPHNSTFKNCTVLGCASAFGGFDFSQDSSGEHGDKAYSVNLINCLSVGCTGKGVYVEDPTTLPDPNTWTNTYSYVWAYDNGTDFSIEGGADAPPNVTCDNTTDPALGTAKCYIPAASPAKGAGDGGADIGANVVYKYIDGTLTDERLWVDELRGGVSYPCFPHGATVAGVNDDAAGAALADRAAYNVFFGAATRFGTMLAAASTTPITYYVDATSGNDANDGIHITTPWKTIAKVNGVAFNAGDTVAFKRGETWAEKLTVPSAGAAGNLLTFTAYGDGDPPVINGGGARNYCIDTNSQDFIAIEKLWCKGATTANVLLSGDDSELVYCLLTGGVDGARMTGADNSIHNCSAYGGSGIGYNCQNNTTIKNSIGYGFTTNDVVIYDGYTLTSVNNCFGDSAAGGGGGATTITQDGAGFEGHTYGKVLTKSVTVGANANRRLMVGFNYISASATVSSVKFNGTDMTLVDSSSGDNINLYLYTLVAPDTGTYDLVITLSADCYMSMGGSVWYNCLQAAGLGTAVKTNDSHMDIHVDLVSAAGELCIDTLGIYDEGGTEPAIYGGQTEQWNDFQGYLARCAGSTEAGALAVEMGWTWADKNQYCRQIGVPMKPSAGGGMGTISDTGSLWNTDPEWTDSANDDFTLKKTSPLINKGADLGYTEDIIDTVIV